MKRFCLILSLFLFLSPPAQGASFNMAINEIAWMGTENSANDEWIEIYNGGNEPINLEGWVLTAEDGTPKINLGRTVLPQGFYLLERTDDETVPGIEADLIYKGALSNQGEYLKLVNSRGEVIDEIDCSSGWLAGDNSTKQTMERTGSVWQNSQNPGGTPKAKNTPALEPPAKKEVSEVEPPASEVEPPKSFPKGIIFNEILPSPEGADKENEWIEIFNQNDFDVGLANWKIRDTQGKTTTYTFPDGAKISAFGYLVLGRPKTKITLNNDIDGLELLHPNREIIDSVSFEKAPLGKSYNRSQSGWSWSSVLTPGRKNEITEPTEAGPLSLKTAGNELTEVGPLSAGGIGEKAAKFPLYPNGKKRLPVLAIALILAVFSAVIILILKKTTAKKARFPSI